MKVKQVVKKNSELMEVVRNLPDKPGIYQFFDNSGQLLYIGKAKSLRNRVNSYFNKIKYENNKIRLMVNKISEIKYILVNTESDALLLENNLIKEYQPKYNVNLKDDKTFPWICITNERFPRVFSTRSLIYKDATYYGPYTSAHTVKTLLNLIRQLYHPRTCKYNLTEKNINQGKFKVCLEFHIGNCKGPCEGLQSEEDYNMGIDQIRMLLKGNLKEVNTYLKNLMTQLAEEYKFEEAEKIKQKVSLLENFQLKSTIVNPKINNVDVFSLLEDGKDLYVNFLKVANGTVIQSHSAEIERKLTETKEEILEFFVAETRNRFSSNAEEIIVPFKLSILPEGIKVSIPSKGDKRKLLDLSERNAKSFMMERKNKKLNDLAETTNSRILNTLKRDLRMTEIPYHIECFDNSNIQGTNPVAACVVFKNARPVKNEYRHYNIKTVKGPDDYASFIEVITRRYTRVIEEGNSLPQLIIIDGGKGQLNAAVKSLDNLNIRNKMAIIGIAKRLEEIFFPDDPVPLYIDKNSESLKLIQKLRNEAHRFGINFHRQKRSNFMLESKLQNLPGIGEKTYQKIWKNFESMSELKNASENEIESLLGKSKAETILKYLKNS